jgi:hypothetical protein
MKLGRFVEFSSTVGPAGGMHHLRVAYPVHSRYSRPSAEIPPYLTILLSPGRQTVAPAGNTRAGQEATNEPEALREKASIRRSMIHAGCDASERSRSRVNEAGPTRRCGFGDGYCADREEWEPGLTGFHSSIISKRRSTCTASVSGAATCQVRRSDGAGVSRMREICMSGLMSGMWKRGTVRIMRQRQTKGPETDRPDLQYRATSRLHRLP